MELHDSKLKMLSILRSIISWQGKSKTREVICNLLKRRSGIRWIQGLVMLVILSFEP
jgi:hypothetical protein